MNKKLGATLAGIALLALPPLTAASEGQDLLVLTAGLTWAHDNNLFRRPANGSLGEVAGDNITTARAGATARLPVSLQLFEFNAGVSASDHERFSDNDATNSSFGATWRWQLSTDWSGTLGADRQQVQTEFSDFRGGIQNQRTTDTQRFSTSYAVTDRSTLGATITEKRERNSQTFVQQVSNRQTIGELSVKHALPIGASLELAHSRSDGENDDGSEFSVDNSDIRLAWPLSPKTNLTSSYGRVSRKYATSAERDFSGNNGSLNLSWLATSKSSVSISATRSTEPWQDVGSSFTVRNATNIQGSWQASAKIAVLASLGRETQAFRGAVTAPATPARHDTTNRQSATLNWTPWQNVSIAGSLQYSRRKSNDEGFNYSDLLSSLTGNLAF